MTVKMSFENSLAIFGLCFFVVVILLLRAVYFLHMNQKCMFTKSQLNTVICKVNSLDQERFV